MKELEKTGEELLRGAYDLHIHTAPDLLPRKLDDMEMAERAEKRGMARFAIKSHYFCTAQRAELVQKAHLGCQVIGSITLNASVGGINPFAVEMAARAGARLVWFPTCDAQWEQEQALLETDPGKKPFWVRIVEQLKESGLQTPAINLLEGGKLIDAVFDVLDVIAKHSMILATGHISHRETFALVKAAKERGVDRMIITHVNFPSTFYTIEEQKELIRMGARLEHCYTTYATGKNPGVQVSVQATAGSNENVRLMKDGEITIANVNDGYNAVTSQGAYEGETPATLRALFNMYTNAYVVCVPAGSTVTSLEDLAGKKVSLGPAGSGVYQAAYALFEAHGLIDRIQIETYSYNDANDALMDGSIDALVGLISGDIPSPALAQLDTSMDLRVLEIDSEKIKSAYEKYPDYADGSISAGCIGAVTSDMKVMAGFTIEYADANLSDEMAYALVKTIYENVDTLSTYHQIARKLSPDTALEGVPPQIPVHPGAAKYYKEIGVWKDSLTVAAR